MSPTLYRRFNSQSVRGVVYQGDAIKYLRSLPASSAAIVFLDPPFNLGKQYSNTDPALDMKSEGEYEAWMHSVLRESVRVIKPGGALYLYHLPSWAMRLGAKLNADLDFRHWIAVSMKNSFVRGDRLYPAHYALLYYTKGVPQNFNRPKLRPSRCRHCGKHIKNYGGYSNIVEEKGLNLSDIWEDISPVRHKSTKLRRENQLPLRFTRRIVEISGAPGEILVDPFGGSGSAVVAAALSGMRFRTCDLVAENCELICARLEQSRLTNIA